MQDLSLKELVESLNVLILSECERLSKYLELNHTLDESTKNRMLLNVAISKINANLSQALSGVQRELEILKNC
ncbi:hypothetical protein [Campylobacter sp. MIT 97-5078]|uniref:hypothetical protein n=1 Tax=Campylobacter sp. MIT 97-5078 TaxID=1548153 RepID=UPI000513A279|nr:hypothetical protein [Campylobacter sp. MIT 97-5078]KGI55108.1 hypothetical protein LR59_13270 [Campylobacter sp. MIT 97-5078]KGI56823.1 hypothetical protein LR59_04910 [Campylobacter sp. MIT 97-5078]TQR25601.1 hypothetical protein DMB91_07300 [Campylobacter sp. MIT 97-5078]